MDFILRRDALEWFKPLEESLVAPAGVPQAWHFDAFYFCFIAGVVSNRKGSLPTGSDRVAVVEQFPGPYKDRGRLLVSVFLAHELASRGVDMDDKQSVHIAMSGLVTPDSPNYLTPDGVQMLSRYAAGGFDELVDWFGHKPLFLHSFVQMFKKFVEESLQRPAADGLEALAVTGGS